MTKEELRKEAEEWLKDNIRVEIRDSQPFNIVPTPVQIYCAGAEPREKRIEIDAEQIRALQKQNGELTDELTKKSDTNHQLVEQMAELNEKCSELEAQIEKMKKYGKLLQDICTVMGNDVYMVSVGLENRVKVLWDSSEEKEGLKMVEDIENRLLKIKPQEWAEITKWEIKEK